MLIKFTMRTPRTYLAHLLLIYLTCSSFPVVGSADHFHESVGDHSHKFCPVHYDGEAEGQTVNSSIDTSHIIVFKSMKYDSGYRLAAFTGCGDGTGLGGYMQMARSVITTSGKVDIDAITSMLNGTAISEGIKQFILSQGPIFAVAGLGLLAGLVVPIAGCCFCCCRCGGRCGGRLPMADARKHTRRHCMGFTGGLLFSTVILLFGTGALYTMGTRMLGVPDRLAHVANFTVDDVLVYKDEIFDHLDQVAKEDLDFVVDGISSLVDDGGVHISDPYMTEGRAFITTLLADLIAVNALAGEIDLRLQSVATIATEIHNNYTVLTSVLSNARSRVQQLYDDCGTSSVPAGTCPGLPDGTAIPNPYDFTQTPTFGPQQTLVTDVDNADLSTLRTQIHDEFEKIPEIVHTSSESTLSEVNNTLRSIADTIQPQLDDLRDKIDNATTSINDIRDGVRDMNEMSVDYIKLGNYGVMGVSGTVFLVLVASVLGMLHGIAGWSTIEHPSGRNAIAHCGRNCLMLSVYMSFVVCAVFFLVGALLFFVGAQLTMLCAPIEDLSILKYLDDYLNDDEYFLGKAILGNGSIPLTVSKVITGCRANEAVYHTLMLSNMLNVSAIVDIEAQMPNMSDIYQAVQDAMSGVSVVPGGALSSLTALRDTPASPINTTIIMADLLAASQDLRTSLSTISSTLQGAATLVAPHDTTYQAAYNTELSNVGHLLNTTYPALDNGVAGLTTRVMALETDLDDIVDRLNSSVTIISALQAFIQGSGPNIMNSGVEGFILLVLSYASQYVTHLDNRLTSDVGRCHVVYDIYNGVTSSLCQAFLDPFNGFWMSVCVIAVFLVVNIILGTKVARYLRRVSHVVQARTRAQRAVAYELKNVEKRAAKSTKKS